MIVVGQKVKDKISGFAGIVIARTEYLYASPRVWIQPEGIGDSGAPKDSLWFDEAQVDPLEPVTHIPNFRSARLIRETEGRQ